jgi:outer membrane immunogenic protein
MARKQTLMPVLSLFGAGAVFASGSFAADLAATTGGYKDVPVEIVQNWAGFYGGVSAGAVNNNDRTSYSYSYLPGNGTNNFSDFFGSAADNVNGSGSAGPLNVPGLNAVQSAQAEGFLPAFLGSSDANGFIGGAQLGYNWQRDRLVAGVETGISFVNQSSSHQFSETIPGAYAYTNAGGSKSSVDWLGTTTFRLGYAFDGLLPYASVGLAYGGVKSSSYSVGTDGSTVDTFSGSVSQTRTGWVAGGGLDYKLGNCCWSFRVEGFYYNLGTASYSVAAQDANTLAEGLFVNARHTFDGAVFRAGINHSF